MSRPPDYRGPALLPGGWSARCGAHSPAPGAGRARTGGYHRVTQRGSVRPATSRGPTVNMYLRLLLFMIRVRFASRLSIWDTSHTAFRVNLADLDVQRHMNNGRFLSIMDLGRMDLMLRSRFWEDRKSTRLNSSHVAIS